MEEYKKAILEPDSEAARNAALSALWDSVSKKGTEIPSEIQGFIRKQRTRDWAQSALIGLLLWKMDGAKRPVPPYILVRVFPGLFADELPDVQEASAKLFDGFSALAFFRSTSDRSLLEEEVDEAEEWYGLRIIGNFNEEICEDYDKRNKITILGQPPR